mgnify:FL=1
MSIGLIEINDSGIDVSIDGQPVLQSPGYAVIDGQRLLLGAQAMQQARLLPRWTHTRFWQQLDTQSLAADHPQVRHSADLAFAHLTSIWAAIKTDTEQVILAIPGDYTSAQLSLLLGMAKEVGLPIRGLVDTALVATVGQHPTHQLLMLDIHLHRVTLSHLQTQEGRRWSKTKTLADTGLYRLWDRWANTIASQFIKDSRYDPLHLAASEQLLYDAVPNWIASREHRIEPTFSLTLETGVHQTPVSTEQLVAACVSLYPAIIQAVNAQIVPGHTTTLLVSHRFAGFPGLMDALALLRGITVEKLSAEAVRHGVAQHLDTIIGAGEPISHITSLAQANADVMATTEAPAGIHRRATHVVFNNHAFAIGQSLKLADIHSALPLAAVIGSRGILHRHADQVLIEAVSADEVYLNQQLVDGQFPVKPGDQLVLDDQSFILISID